MKTETTHDNTEARPHRILLIEDDFAIRNSIEFALRREGYEVKALDSGSESVDTVLHFEPDLVLLDIMLPGKNGHEITEELRKSDIAVAIIMISALGETNDRITGLRLGADDYVSKPFSLEELLERVRANLRRTTWERSTAEAGRDNAEKLVVLKYGEACGEAHASSDGDCALLIDPMKHEVEVCGTPIALRAKEFALLYTLASRPGEVLSREFLSEEVWGHGYLHSSRTIDVHIRRLRALLADHGAPDYLGTVHGVGYRFEEEAEGQSPKSEKQSG